MLARAAVAVVISPLGASAVLGIAALTLSALRRPRLASALGGVALAWLLLWSTPEASHALRCAALEVPYPPVPVAELPTAQAIVVLGGGIAPPSALVLEEHSRNTAENARMTQVLLQQRGIRRVLLVTSVLHMPRARAHVEAVGLEVIPAATDHEGRLTTHWPWWQRWLPDTDAPHGSARELKGQTGLLA